MGINLITHSKVVSVTKISDRNYQVQIQIGKEEFKTIEVNSILVAIGRDPNTPSLRLENANIQIDPATKKILGRK